MRQSWLVRGAAFVVLQLLAVAAWAQGVLVVMHPREPVPLPRPMPREMPPMSYKIKELAVNARLLDQVARVQVSQSFVNTGSQQMEVSFVFPLPYEGAIDQLTFLVDGKEIPGKLMSAKDARSIYEGHVRRNRDPALLEWIGTGMFQTSVFPVPPGAERKVTLRYSQLLRKDRGLTDFLFPLSTAKYTSAAVEKVEITANIESSIDIKGVFSPTHPIEIKRPGPKSAVVAYVSKNEIPTSDFRLFFDVDKGQLGAAVLSYRPEENEDGYFLLLASPQIKAADAERPKKTVVCVFDRSGSMSGKKIEQAKEALKFVLGNLRDGDLFNIIAYDSEVEMFRPELQRFSDQTRKEALGFVEGLFAGGSTNIHGAVTAAMKMLQDSSRPNFVLFMTDGLPTAGETNEARIVAAAKEHNKVRARLINFGVGYDVNSRLLDRMARENFGQCEYVRPNENIEAQVARLYSKISSPVMTDAAVKFEFDAVKVEEGDPIQRMYPKQIHDLFEGEQVVLVGRYKKTGVAKVSIAGRVAGVEQKFAFPVDLVKKSNDQTYAFVEKLWAMRRIGEIIDELDLKGKNDELVKELVALSTKHGILTPYTSFLADETAKPGDLAMSGEGGKDTRRKAAELLERLGEAEGKSGVAQRDFKRELTESHLANEPAARPADPSADTAGDRSGGQGFAYGAKLRDIDKDRDITVQAVQVVENKVLYKRGNVWYSFDVAKQGTEDAAKKAKVVARFSKEYFELVGKADAASAKMLSRQQAGEELMLKVQGEVYHVK
jgi:Ca-activated chloride channel family protein